ncbi:Hypothetical predicted protein [Mytilus galloprovincialis]|uniref:Reverse transcriptase domain-containing protein n=1 Tax=Mytilus galloprovincialis TaxID=29158 RepID=A0A8B6DNF0_MYTGA|nr:Hypothetical predicted protein [Mytilus galloprovincialis]
MEKEEPNSRITPDAQGPQLPASTMDLTMDNMVDVTPSGEVQMRVTKGVYRQDEEPKTIGDCVRVGVEYEAFVVDQKRLTNTKPAIRMQHDTPFEQIDDEDNILGQIAKMSHQLDDMAKFQKSNDYSGVTCFYCGIKGATLCIIHPRKFDAFPPEVKSLLKINKRKLCMANGDSIPTLGTIDLPVKIGGSSITQKFTVAEIDAPAVLGYDFLHKNKCNLDLGFGILTINGIKINCMKLSQMPSVFKVSINEKMTIPAHTEMIVNATIQGDSSHIMDAIVEQVMSNHTSNLLVAKALVDPSQGHVPLRIRIANLTDEVQTVFKSTCTAVCESVDMTQRYEDTCKVSQMITKENSEDIPLYLQDMFERSSSNLSESQVDELKQVLVRHKGTFSKTKDDLGRATAIRHKINTGTATPVKLQPRRLPFHKREEADKEVQRLLDCGIIEPSKSPWSTSLVLVKKKDSSTRICTDFRILNSKTIKDSYPLPRIDDSLDALRGSKWFSVLDLSSGYFQFEMDPQDKEKTAFSTSKDLVFPDKSTQTRDDNLSRHYLKNYVPDSVLIKLEPLLTALKVTGLWSDSIAVWKKYLSKYVSSNQKDWDEQLPWAFMAYRSSVHESTKFSPCKMMLGREIELPTDLIYGPHPQHEDFIDETQVVNEHMIQITQNMWKVHEKARQNMVNASENQKKQYDIKSYQHSYQKGNVVWLYTPTRVKNISPKLQRKWDGPYFIVTVLSDVTYKIQKNPSSRSQVVHHDRLKPYYGEVNNWVI